MGGANVGPEFTTAEYQALVGLVAKERALCASRDHVQPARLLEALEAAVYRSNRWQKWLQPEERNQDFADLTRRGAVGWCRPAHVIFGLILRCRLRGSNSMPTSRPTCPTHIKWLCAAVARALDAYVAAFGLFDANHRLGVAA